MITHTDSSQLRQLDMDRDLSTATGKRRYVRTLFDTVEGSYDWFTRLFSVGMDGAWKKRMVDLLARRGLSRGLVLDLATGTGDIVDRLQARIPDVYTVGVDLSSGMLRRAATRGKTGNAVADMTALPYRPRTITAITAGYAFRNAPDCGAALAEAHRVLAPGGLLVTLDFYLPASRPWREVYLTYLRVAGRLVGRVVHGVPEAYGYIAASLERWMAAGEFSRLLGQAGFAVERQVSRLGGGIAIHLARKQD